jgi:hypothetical protein
MNIITKVMIISRPSKQRLDEGAGEHALDLVDGGGARHDVAQVALLEVVQRQADKVAEDVGFPLHADGSVDDQQQPGPQACPMPCCRNSTAKNRAPAW